MAQIDHAVLNKIVFGHRFLGPAFIEKVFLTKKCLQKSVPGKKCSWRKSAPDKMVQANKCSWQKSALGKKVLLTNKCS